MAQNICVISLARAVKNKPEERHRLHSTVSYIILSSKFFLAQTQFNLPAFYAFAFLDFFILIIKLTYFFTFLSKLMYEKYINAHGSRQRGGWGGGCGGGAPSLEMETKYGGGGGEKIKTKRTGQDQPL